MNTPTLRTGLALTSLVSTPLLLVTGMNRLAEAQTESCPTWETLEAVVRADQIRPPGPLPTLPEGFRQGCVTAEAGAHTLNVYVYRNDIELEFALEAEWPDVSGDLHELLPPQASVVSDLPSGQINALHFGFDGGYGYENIVNRYQAWHEPYISAYGTVTFRYTWATLMPPPEELPPQMAADMLARLATNLEATRSEYSPEVESHIPEPSGEVADRSSCWAPLYLAQRQIEARPDVTVVKALTEPIPVDRYANPPSDRPNAITIAIEGEAVETLMGDTALQQSISEDILSNCPDVGLVKVGVWRSSYSAISGWVDGEPQSFRCTDLGLVSDQKLPWGERYCGL